MLEYVLIAFDGIPELRKDIRNRGRGGIWGTHLWEFKKDYIPKIVSEYQMIRIHLLREEYDKDHFYVDIRTAIEYVYSMYHDMTLHNDISGGIMSYRKKPHKIWYKGWFTRSSCGRSLIGPYGGRWKRF